MTTGRTDRPCNHVRGWTIASVYGLVLMAICACGTAEAGWFTIAGHDYQTRAARHLELPADLREISGLALGADDQVYAHDDERGIIHEIDITEDEPRGYRLYLVPPVRADFEGIARLGQTLYLVSASGRIFETIRDAESESLRYVRHPGGRKCEVEGLTAAPDGTGLLVVCKRPPKKSQGLVIYHWNDEKRAYASEPAVLIARQRLARFLEDHGLDGKQADRLRPSGIDVAPNGNLVIVAARNHLLLELTRQGEPVALARLDPNLHPQAEGIAIREDGRLYIASEAGDDPRTGNYGTLSIYDPIQ